MGWKRELWDETGRDAVKERDKERQIYGSKNQSHPGDRSLRTDHMLVTRRRRKKTSHTGE